VAEEAARSLAGTLEKDNPGDQVILYVGNVYRETGDLNRRATRSTSFRQSIRHHLRNGTSLLLDIHSFPSDSSWAQEAVAVTDGSIHDELVILDNKPGETAWVIELFRFLKGQGIRVLYRMGSLANDIVREARDHGVPAVLLEFHEALSSTRIEAIGRRIAWFVEARLGAD
jgi:hypothetical protein